MSVPLGKGGDIIVITSNLIRTINEIRSESSPALRYQPNNWNITYLDWTLPRDYIGVYLNNTFFGIYDITANKIMQYHIP